MTAMKLWWWTHVFTGRIKITFVNTVYKIIDSRLLLTLTCFYYHFIDLNISGQEKRSGTGLSQNSANYYQDRKAAVHWRIFNLSIKHSQVTKSIDVGNIISGNNTFPSKNANLKMYDHKGDVHDLLHYCYSIDVFYHTCIVH